MGLVSLDAPRHVLGMDPSPNVLRRLLNRLFPRAAPNEVGGWSWDDLADPLAAEGRRHQARVAATTAAKPDLSLNGARNSD